MNRPNVIVFMIDTFRPDHLEPWGPPSRPTPNFKRLADEGVFFRDFFAHMPSSHPSRASVLTGRDPHTCGMRVNSRPLPAEETTLTQLLKDAGYLTAATRSESFPPGLGRGFQEVDLVRKLFASGKRPWEIVSEIPPCSDAEARSQIAQDTAALIAWLKEYVSNPDRRGRPFFFWADVEDVHGAWRPPPPFNTMYTTEPYDGPDVSTQPTYAPGMPEEQKRHAIALYDGMVAFVDKYIGILLDALEEMSLAENTLLIVMSDHAGSMGEHDMWGKMSTLYDPVLRSVLVMRQRGVLPAGVQTSGLAIMNDVFATVVEHVGLALPDAAKGYCTSLRPLWEGKRQVRDQIPLEFNLHRGTVAKGIRTERWKYIYNRWVSEERWNSGISPAEIWRSKGWARVMLFDLENDPGETVNVLDLYPEVAQEMQERLINWLIDSENNLPAPTPEE